MTLSVRASGFVMSESWFVLTVSALTATVTGALNKAVSFLWPVSSLKTFWWHIRFRIIINSLAGLA